MIRNWNTVDLKNTISKIGYYATDPGLTGYATWPLKKELYEILWHTQEILNQCSTYGDLENEFIKDHDKKEIWKALKK